MSSTSSTRWWFQIFFIFIPTWGRFPFWRAYFSHGLGWFNHQLANIPWAFQEVLQLRTDLPLDCKGETGPWNLWWVGSRDPWVEGSGGRSISCGTVALRMCFFSNKFVEFSPENYWLVLSDEQMSNGWSFSLLNDEQMSNKVGVKHQPD